MTSPIGIKGYSPRHLPGGLTRQQAVLLRELSYTPGKPVRWDILADALAVPGDLGRRDRARRVCSYVQTLRRRFGRETIVTVFGEGYAVAPEALGGSRGKDYR